MCPLFHGVPLLVRELGGLQPGLDAVREAGESVTDHLPHVRRRGVVGCRGCGLRAHLGGGDPIPGWTGGRGLHGVRGGLFGGRRPALLEDRAHALEEVAHATLDVRRLDGPVGQARSKACQARLELAGGLTEGGELAAVRVPEGGPEALHEPLREPVKAGQVGGELLALGAGRTLRACGAVRNGLLLGRRGRRGGPNLSRSDRLLLALTGNLHGWVIGSAVAKSTGRNGQRIFLPGFARARPGAGLAPSPRENAERDSACIPRQPPGERPPVDDLMELEGAFDSEGEASYACWACGEEVVIPIDPTMGHRQDYVEDCPVCCRPNEIHVELDPEDGHVRCWNSQVG